MVLLVVVTTLYVLNQLSAHSSQKNVKAQNHTNQLDLGRR